MPDIRKPLRDRFNNPLAAIDINNYEKSGLELEYDALREGASMLFGKDHIIVHGSFVAFVVLLIVLMKCCVDP